MTFLEHLAGHWEDYDAMLFDIDGTLLGGGAALPGCVELLAALESGKMPYLVLTNDAYRSVAEKHDTLRHGGLDIPVERIVSSGNALNALVLANNWQGRKFFLLGRLGNPCFGVESGLDMTSDVEQLEQCDGVINGEGYYDWHDHMQSVINFFRRKPDAPFVVPNPDSYWPARQTGSVGVGAGGQARFITSLLREMSIEVNPVYLGKPYRPIYDYAAARLRRTSGISLLNGRMLMLGDSLRSDVAGANNCGMISALTLTGITSPAEAAAATGECKPMLVFESVG